MKRGDTKGSRRRTAIIATLGPSCSRPEDLLAAMQAGAGAFRLNCSHVAPDDIAPRVDLLRSVAARRGEPVGILLDLQGPKIRTGPVDAPMALERGGRLVLVMDPSFVARGHRVGSTYAGLAADLAPGQRLLLDDGAMAARIREIHLERRPAEVVLEMEDGGLLGSHKGINVPGLPLSVPALTGSDLEHLERGLDAGVDAVALSFVRRADDIRSLRRHMTSMGHPEVPVCAKIEKPQALDDLDAILRVSDMIMVARGDLGVELDLARVPLVQKSIIDAANRAGILVITATQMLDSMRRHPRPTRAEVTDVSNAILDGTDALLLTGETAAGDYPVEAVAMMDRIALETERSPFFRRPSLKDLPHFTRVDATVTMAACYTARDREIPLLVYTWSGATAALAAKSRPTAPLYALTPNPAVPGRLALAWGVTTVLVPKVSGTEEMIAAGEKALLEKGLLRPGEQVVVLTGRAPTRGATNTMTVALVGAASA